MHKKEVVALVFLFVLLLSFSFAFAGFTKGDALHSITKEYPPNSTIKGWINISLTGESINSLFTGIFGGSISLINLLKENNFVKGTHYTCSTADCKSDYSESEASTFKSFNLGPGESVSHGFRLDGATFNSISKFAMNVTSTSTESTINQLEIDILNDGLIEWESYKGSGNFQVESYGCYNNPPVGQALITQDEYCEMVTLPKAPNVSIGAAVIQKPSGGAVTFELTIRNNTFGDFATCDATATTTESIICSPNLRIEEDRQFSICIKTKLSGDNEKYEIDYEKTNTCGYAGSDTTFDFKIFGSADKFAPVGSFVLNNSELVKFGSNLILENYINTHIGNKYGNVCTNGCVVPIKFTSNQDQFILINMSASYSAGIATTTKNLYNVSETAALINSGFNKILLDKGNFSTPSGFGTGTFSLKLDGTEILSEKISVKKIPQIKSITPKTAIAALSTEFVVNVETFGANSSITEYTWKFGDNSSIGKSSVNKISHTYTKVGKYNLEITIKNSDNFTTSRIFEITAATPKEAVNQVLSQRIKSLNDIKAQLNALPLFHQTSLKKILDLTAIEIKLTELIQENTTATNDQQDYVNIMLELNVLANPRGIFETGTADSFTFFSARGDINLDALKSIGGGDYDNSKKKAYEDSILAWNLDNVVMKLTFREYSVGYDDFVERELNVYELAIEGDSSRGDSLLIMPEFDNLEFDKDYSETKKSSYVGIEITSSNKEIKFSTTEGIGFSELPIFISPPVTELSVLETEEDVLDKLKLNRTTFFILILIFVVILGVVAYIIIAKWYQKKYEGHLFKNKNDLYNIVNYVHASKKRGIKNGEIIYNLKKANWRTEQIKYVMRKYSGKRTGLLGGPVEKIIEKKSRERRSR